MPDAINCSLTKDFTQVPNTLLRDPTLSAKAKAVHCLLLSNKQGWCTHRKTLQTLMKEGDSTIDNALVELEKRGWLMRVRYRNKHTKIWIGSFWAYTDVPGQFNMKEQLESLEEKGLEPHLKKPYLEKPHLEKPHLENHPPNNINNKKTNSNKTNKNIPSQKNLKYLPLAEKLSRAVSSTKNIHHDRNQIKAWANEIRRLVETNKVAFNRVENVLDWYEDHIGGQYIPVVESGAALRQKFIRLEQAMETDGYKSPIKTKPKTREKDYTF